LVKCKKSDAKEVLTNYITGHWI